MKPLCIIGNSHMASLHGAALKTRVQGVDMFMSDGMKLSHLYLKAGHLVSAHPALRADLLRSGNREDICLGDYSHILVFGCQMLCRGFGDDWLLFFRSTLPGSGYSQRSVRQACLDHLQAAFGTRLAAMIRQGDRLARVGVLPSPLPSEIHALVESVAADAGPEHAYRVLGLVESLYREYFDRLEIDLLWFQRALLASNGFTTDLRYRNESAGDVSHLNEAGAEHVLQIIAGHVQSGSAAVFPGAPADSGRARQ